ncbi:MAG: type I glyceraldehyde-3-phosphate dehydrogenase [bacterium]|nr:type I glyceraldehyde-3-phosphate dehydrogenase [bacterium]
MAKTRIAINGFGRIGRVFFRQAFGHPDLEIVAINDPHDHESSCHLLKYDSTYGIYPHEISCDAEHMIVDGVKIKALHERDPKNLPWKELSIDIAIEATGIFTSREQVEWHRQAGAKKVLLTAPPKDDLDVMLLMGVNEQMFDPKRHHLISNASCTTNSLAPVAKVLHEAFGIKRGFMTTVHSFTNDQSTLDAHHRDPRRARTATASIIPTTTGAAEAVAKVIPELQGKLTGLALRVPTQTVSVTDFVAELDKEVTVEDVNTTLKKAAEGKLKGILAVSEEPLVSVDYKGNDHSSIVDALSTMVLGGNLVKILTWYDNEWGYSHRLVDLCAYMGNKM